MDGDGSGDAHLEVRWIFDPNEIARALGIVIQLPDIWSGDKNFLKYFDRLGWRRSLKGKTAMTDYEIEYGAKNWVRLRQLSKRTSVWFSFEKGIVFRCPLAEIQLVVEVIVVSAKFSGLPLCRPDTGFVCASGPTYPSTEEPKEFKPMMEAVGFIWDTRLWRLTRPVL